MLDPSDRAFLDQAVRSSRLTRTQAEGLASRYNGEPGGLSAAMVQAGLLDSGSVERIHGELRRASGPLPLGGGRRPDTIPQTTPGSARYAQGSARLPRSGLPRIPGYTMEGELGRGGMGAVYKAIHEETGQRVAVKVLLNAGERQIARFEREIEALRRLSHPAVVKLVDFGKTGGHPYLTMEYQRGGDLQTAMDQGSIGRQQALRMIAQVARALQEAHGLGILHRDLKPANILLDEEGQPKVTDFGLAKIIDRETQLTRTNASLGTPYYMAPEQVRGADYTPAVDVYGLGVILYQLLTGEYPFDGEGKVELFSAILERPATPPWKTSDVPRDLGMLVLWALEKDPLDRPTCLQLAKALESHLAGARLRVRVPSLRRGKVRRLAFAAIGAGLVLGIGGILASLGPSNAEPSGLSEDQVQALKQATSAARRERSGRALEDLLRELSAHQAVEELMASLPESSRVAAVERVAHSRERHAELIAQCVPLLLQAERVAEASAIARRLTVLHPGPASDVYLAGVLARRLEQRQEAFELLRPYLSSPPKEPQVLSTLAEDLLRLHRPRLAAKAVEDAPSELLPLRARARERAGDWAGARDDARRAAESSPGDLTLASLRARLELVCGEEPEPILARLDLLRGGANAGWHASRARVLEALGRHGAAGSALREALTLDLKGFSGQAAKRLLRRGRRREAEARLAARLDTSGRGSAADRLDLAIARWLGGAPDDDSIASLVDVAADAESYSADPLLGAVAARWQARVEVARNALAAAEAAARKAWDADPSPRSAETLAWVLWRRGDTTAARAALEQATPSTVEGRLLAGRLALAARDLPAVEIITAALPKNLPGRRGLELRLAREREDPTLIRARTEALYGAWKLGVPGRCAAAPVASEEGPTPRTLASRRLLHEAVRRLGPAGERRAEAREAVLLLARRALRLDPENLPARTLVATLGEDLDALSKLVEDHPTLLAARRARIEVHRRLVKRGVEVDPRGFREDYLAMAPAQERLSPEEQVLVARSYAAEQSPRLGWDYLQPLLSQESPREFAALAAGFEIAHLLGKDDEAARLKGLMDEVRASYARQSELLKQAYYGDEASGLPRALQALRILERDIPHGSSYWMFRAQAYLGQARFGKAIVSGAEYLHAVSAGLKADSLSLWIHAYGWTPQVRDELVREITTERIRDHPWDPVPWLARAMFHSARYNLHPQPDPEDLEAAADQLLYAFELDPKNAGVAALAANVLVSLGEGGEAKELIGIALTIDPTCEFATFQSARLAASKGDAVQTVGILSGISRMERPKNYKQLQEDPIFAKVQEDPDFQAFLRRFVPK